MFEVGRGECGFDDRAVAPGLEAVRLWRGGGFLRRGVGSSARGAHAADDLVVRGSVFGRPAVVGFLVRVTDRRGEVLAVRAGRRRHPVFALEQLKGGQRFEIRRGAGGIVLAIEGASLRIFSKDCNRDR